MLALATEELLCSLLAKLAQLERGVEIQRNILAEDYAFSPHSAFEQLDSYRLGWLLPKSLKDYLARWRPELTEQDLYLVVRQYSYNSNGRLSLNDFMHLVLPVSNPSLNQIASRRRNYSMSYAHEYALSRLIEREVDLQLELESLRNQLSRCEDFSVWKAFKTIDERGCGAIREEDLVSFGRKHGHYFFRADIDAILRRIQTRDNDRIDYDDFIDFVMPVYCKKQEDAVKNEESQECPEQVEETQENLEENEETQESPEKNEETRENLEKKEGEESPEKKPELQERQAEAKKLFADTEMNGLLTQQVLSERKLESIRQRLAILSNFSIDQLFVACNPSNEEYASINDFETLLKALDVSYNKEHLKNTLKRLTGDSSKITKDGLQKLVLPANSEYANKVIGRNPEKFNKNSLEHLKEFFNAVFKGEEEIEKSRKDVSNNCDVEELFKEIDADADGVISTRDLSQALLKIGLDVTENETHMLFGRYLHAGNQKLDLQSFREEIQSVCV